MLTVSAEQNGREITEADLVDAFEDWSWMGQREEGGHTGYRHYQLFMQATSRIRLSTVRARSSTVISICTRIRASEPIWRNCVTPW